jgi:hypothetical protein
MTNAPTEHTLVLYIIVKTIKRTLIKGRSTVDNMIRFLINRGQRSLHHLGIFVFHFIISKALFIHRGILGYLKVSDLQREYLLISVNGLAIFVPVLNDF